MAHIEREGSLVRFIGEGGIYITSVNLEDNTPHSIALNYLAIDEAKIAGVLTPAKGRQFKSMIEGYTQHNRKAENQYRALEALEASKQLRTQQKRIHNAYDVLRQIERLHLDL